MGCSTLLVFLSCILPSLCLRLSTAQFCSNTVGNFTTNSTYAKNRNLMLSSLPSNATASGGFYTGTIGQGSDTVYALAMCRGDLSSENCFNCIDTPSQAIMKNCPNQKEAVDWPPVDPRCIARCSNRSFFGILDNIYPGYNVYITSDITTNVDDFDVALNSLIDNLLVRAARGSSILKFATGNGRSTSQTIVIVVVSIVISLVLVALAACAILRLRKPKKNLEGIQEKNFCFYLKLSWTVNCQKLIAMFSSIRRGEDVSKNEESLRFDFGTIRVATNDFSDTNKLGQGGFGLVYKVTINKHSCINCHHEK
ncbi:hypothetical protein F0562_018933 [Nyssa sinensis]|uniref:Gnk2-homologous domain-containing protein n=1 Tax=Nyssa sinensis TaxID=561372 RepID=A0A5J4ZCJ7_9ASTE|nr:hypothetical protein F0562_018933 [Nyssa sinensis]